MYSIDHSPNGDFHLINANKLGRKVVKKNRLGGRPAGSIQSAAKELNLEQARTNPVRSMVEG